MQIFKVKSLPIKEVLENIGSQVGGSVHVDCDYYTLSIPKKYGTGGKF